MNVEDAAEYTSLRDFAMRQRRRIRKNERRMIVRHDRLGVGSRACLAKGSRGTHQSVRGPSSIFSDIDTVRQDLEQWLDVGHVRPEKRHSDAMEESVDLSDTSKGRPGRWKLCVQMLNNTEYEFGDAKGMRSRHDSGGERL